MMKKRILAYLAISTLFVGIMGNNVWAKSLTEMHQEMEQQHSSTKEIRGTRTTSKNGIESTTLVSMAQPTSNVQKSERAKLVGIRANSNVGYTRIVLEINNRKPYWDVQYDKNKETLNLILPDTVNDIKKPIIIQNKGSVLQEILAEERKDQSLKFMFVANQPVQHNLFTLDNPERIVIDLFTTYSQKTQKKLSDTVRYTRWDRSITTGRLRIYEGTINSDGRISRQYSKNGINLQEWYANNNATLIAPLSGDSLTKAHVENKKEKIYTYLSKNSNQWHIEFSKNQLMGIQVPGIPILENGKYIGPQGADGEYTRPSSTFLGTKNNGELALIVIEGGIPASVGASLNESAKLLVDMNIVNAVCIARGIDAQMYIKGELVPIENQKPDQKYTQVISIS